MKGTKGILLVNPRKGKNKIKKVKMIPNISAILTNISGPICEEISERIKSSTTNYKK